MPPTNDPPPYASPPYRPPRYLLSSTGLSREDLISQYEEFRHTIPQVETAPELVFERLVGNLSEVFGETLARERTQRAVAQCQHAAAQETWRREKIALEADMDRVTTAAKNAEKIRFPLPAATSDQTYLQFWLSSTCFAEDYNVCHVHANSTTTPAPYGIAIGWPDIDAISSSTNHGTYDTRMDTSLTTPTLPPTVIQIVRFEQAFYSPPKIVVWLTGLSAATGSAVSVNVTATDVTETQFALQISCGDGGRLVSVGVAWGVWPCMRTVKVGSVSTVSSAGERVAVLGGAGVLPQGSDGVILDLFAVCAVDLVLGRSFWMQAKMYKNWEESLGEPVFTWDMSAGPADISLYSVKMTHVSHDRC